MSKRYYYGLKDQETYTAIDPYKIFEELETEYDDQEITGFIIIEMMISRKHGMRWCMEESTFIEDDNWCGSWCSNYKSRNGKSGICKHRSWGLIETGRKWEITGKGQLKKLSCRKKVKHG